MKNRKDVEEVNDAHLLNVYHNKFNFDLFHEQIDTHKFRIVCSDIIKKITYKENKYICFTARECIYNAAHLANQIMIDDNRMSKECGAQLDAIINRLFDCTLCYS